MSPGELRVASNLGAAIIVNLGVLLRGEKWN